MTGITAVAAGFYPTNSIFITLSNQTVAKVAVGTTATATYIIASDGTVRNHNNSILETWLGGSGGLPSSYECRATLTSGSIDAGTLGTWLSCSGGNGWSVIDTLADGNTQTGTITIEIRDAAVPNTVRASASIILQASKESSL